MLKWPGFNKQTTLLRFHIHLSEHMTTHWKTYSGMCELPCSQIPPASAIFLFSFWLQSVTSSVCRNDLAFKTLFDCKSVILSFKSFLKKYLSVCQSASNQSETLQKPNSSPYLQSSISLYVNIYYFFSVIN